MTHNDIAICRLEITDTNPLHHLNNTQRYYDATLSAYADQTRVPTISVILNAFAVAHSLTIAQLNAQQKGPTIKVSPFTV